jgi:hypothetical protein
MTADYAAFIPVVNRPDLLLNTIDAVRPLWDELTVIDNSPERRIGKAVWQPVSVYTPPVPFLFTQTMNWELEETLRRGRPFCVHMHNDAIIPEGACEKLLDCARQISQEHERWGVIYTLHDILCVYNPRVFADIGGYDTNFAAYFSDNDYFRRMELGGWKRFISGIKVGHVGSQTINSDPMLRHINNVTFPLYREYYRAKWGGVPDYEQFTHPFGVRIVAT